MFLCARASVKASECYVPRHGHGLRPGLSYVTGIWHHSVPLLTIGLHIVRFFEHLVASHDGFVQLLHVRPQSAISTPPAPLRPLLNLWIELLPVSFHSVLRVLMYLSRLLIVAVANELATLRCVSLAVSASQERKQRGTRGAPRHCASTVQSDQSGSRAVFLQRSITVVILTSKLDHFFTRASWAATKAWILDDQLFAIIAERFDQRCDAEKLQVLSSLKTCIFLLICEPLAS